MTTSFVTEIEKSAVKKMREDLFEQGFSLDTPPHTIFKASKPGISCILYSSMKLVVQGKKMREFIEFYLEPEILKQPEYTHKETLALESLDRRSRIGCDEAGKGDYFGPLCVAGVYAEEKDLEKLVKIGVKDSKKLSDTSIKKMAKEIIAFLPHYIIRLKPKKYNELYASFKNLNHLLAWSHASIIENLAQRFHPECAVVDQFAKEITLNTALKKKNVKLPVEQRVGGESDIVVAAASILARWAFVEALEEEEKRINHKLPKGASNLVMKAAKDLVRLHGKDILKEVAKYHFVLTAQLLCLETSDDQETEN